MVKISPDFALSSCKKMRWLSTDNINDSNFLCFRRLSWGSPPLLKLPRREIDMFLQTNQRWPEFGFAQRLVSLVLTKRIAASGNEIDLSLSAAERWTLG